jgi:DNA-binding SARP family transcriptional activator
MHFRLLGPLEVSDDNGKTLHVGRPKLRQLLSILLLEANRQVPMADLIQGLWDEEPPRSAVGVIRTSVWQLRRLFSPVNPGSDLLHTTGDGYQIVVNPRQLDIVIFRELARQGWRKAGHDDAAAFKLLGRALASWRGVALQDVPISLSLRATVDALQEERQATFEEWVNIGLVLGRHQKLLPTLRRETVRFPLRERTWGHLMLALFQSGRKADALEAFHRLRRGLVTELGLEPCWQLRELHDRIIADDQTLSTGSSIVFDASAAGSG